MLLNVSYNNKEINSKINSLLGKPFSLKERIKMGGIGSPKLVISETSIEITYLMNLDNNRNVCNIEMRPKGIIVGFRSLLDSYGIIVHYHKLVITKGNGDEYAIQSDNFFIRIKAPENDNSIHDYIKKIVLAKAVATSGNITEN